MITNNIRAVLLVFFAGVIASTGAAAPTQSQPVAVNAAAVQAPGAASQKALSTYEVPLYKAITVPLHTSAKRVSIGNPGIADIVVIRSQELYVVGKALGNTNVMVWDSKGNVSATFNVEVTHDIETLKTKLHDLLPGEDIKVQTAQGQLVLSGQVSSAARTDAAQQLAAGFLPDCISARSDAPGQPANAVARPAGLDNSCRKGKVVNLMQVGGASQVMLKVTVAEMARTVVKKLDSQLNIMNFGSNLSGGAATGGATFPNALSSTGLLAPVNGTLGSSPILGPPSQLFQPKTPTIDSTGAFLSYLSGGVFIEETLNISKRNGLAKILSEPTLTTLTGQEAQFLSGGEFPIPVPQGGSTNSTTIQFKEFGVAVKFLPVVLDSGRINLSINISVSDLSTDNNVVLQNANSSSSFLIPSLTKRSASTVVEVADGQTIGIAGLINDNMQEFVQKFPGLGDLPLLGPLFRSQQFKSGQTELVMFVTPHLAMPINPRQVRLPTDGFVPPSDLDFYLLGRLEGKGESAASSRSDNPRNETPPKGNFGHDVSPAP